MYDCDNNLLSVGDRVSMIEFGYRVMQVGRIKKFTRYMVVIVLERSSKVEYRMDPERIAKVYTQNKGR